MPPTIYSQQPMDNQITMAEWGIRCYGANHGYAKLSPESAASVFLGILGSASHVYIKPTIVWQLIISVDIAFASIQSI